MGKCSQSAIRVSWAFTFSLWPTSHHFHVLAGRKFPVNAHTYPSFTFTFSGIMTCSQGPGLPLRGKKQSNINLCRSVAKESIPQNTVQKQWYTMVCSRSEPLLTLLNLRSSGCPVLWRSNILEGLQSYAELLLLSMFSLLSHQRKSLTWVFLFTNFQFFGVHNYVVMVIDACQQIRVSVPPSLSV